MACGVVAGVACASSTIIALFDGGARAAHGIAAASAREKRIGFMSSCLIASSSRRHQAVASEIVPSKQEILSLAPIEKCLRNEMRRNAWPAPESVIKRYKLPAHNNRREWWQAVALHSFSGAHRIAS